jgi:hypothetical protein
MWHIHQDTQNVLQHTYFICSCILHIKACFIWNDLTICSRTDINSVTVSFRADGCVHVQLSTSDHYNAHTDQLTTVLLRTGDETKKKLYPLCYPTVHLLMMDRWGKKHVAVCMLKHYCDSNEVCAFVGLRCGNGVVMHGQTMSNCTAHIVINV